MQQESVLDFTSFVEKANEPNMDGWAFESELIIETYTEETKKVLSNIVLEVTDDEDLAKDVLEEGVVFWGNDYFGKFTHLYGDDLAIEIVKRMFQEVGKPCHVSQLEIKFFDFPYTEKSNEWGVFTLEGSLDENNELVILD